MRAAGQGRADVAARRAEWRAGQAGLDPDRLVFLDETWATTPMARRYGWGPTHQRVVGRVPHGHWKTTTFVAALRADGLTAPMVIDGALTGDLFVAYVRQVLAPALRPGDVVVMDNLRCHKRAEGLRAIEAAGCRVAFLPSYSPDLNPIEHAFRLAKQEAGLMGDEGRNYTGLVRHLTPALIVLGFVTTHAERLRGENPQVTAEQVCRALNQRCRAVFRRRRRVPEVRHTSEVICYHQRRNAQAAKSHKKRRQKCVI